MCFEDLARCNAADRHVSAMPQGQPLHCSGEDGANTTSCEIFNESTLQYHPVPSIPTDCYFAPFAFQLVRKADRGSVCA
jgi:hypothetical protein